MGQYSAIQTAMICLSVLFIAICFSLVAGECRCNGDGDSDYWAPCSSDYGDGLYGLSEYRRWCYVDRGDCWDEKEALKTPRWWSHQACYKDGPPRHGNATSNGRNLVQRYGGGGSGSYRRGGTCGRKWCIG